MVQHKLWDCQDHADSCIRNQPHPSEGQYQLQDPTGPYSQGPWDMALPNRKPSIKLLGRLKDKSNKIIYIHNKKLRDTQTKKK